MKLTEMLYHEDRTKKKAVFTKYFDGNLWYKTEDGFEFPVSISDIGTATFTAEDVAPLFMRWIRKHKELKDEN